MERASRSATLWAVEGRSPLTVAQATQFLGISPGSHLPDEEALLADAEEILDVHARVLEDVASLAAQGLQLSPIWETRGDEHRARLAVRPPALRARVLTAASYDAMEGAWIDALVLSITWLFDDPIGAAHALEDTHRLWFDAEAPTRALDVRPRPHLRVLSMTLADLGRKKSAGFAPLEWLASLGLPLAEARAEVDGEGDDAAIAARARERSVAMWAEELRWKKAAFGR